MKEKDALKRNILWYNSITFYLFIFLMYSHMLRYFFVFTLIVGTVFLSGCGSTVDDVDLTDSQDKQQGSTVNNRPERVADVTGIVKSIVGNELVINQVDMEAVREEMKANMPEGAEPNKEEGSNLVGTQTGPSGGIPGMGGGMRTNSTGDAREVMDKIMKEHSLGDVKVLVPVGIPMYSRGEEASLVDLTVGSNITIWLNSSVEDRKIAEFVNL